MYGRTEHSDGYEGQGARVVRVLLVHGAGQGLQAQREQVHTHTVQAMPAVGAL